MLVTACADTVTSPEHRASASAASLCVAPALGLVAVAEVVEGTDSLQDSALGHAHESHGPQEGTIVDEFFQPFSALQVLDREGIKNMHRAFERVVRRFRENIGLPMTRVQRKLTRFS